MCATDPRIAETLQEIIGTFLFVYFLPSTTNITIKSKFKFL